jgi:hypothetical protein
VIAAGEAAQHPSSIVIVGGFSENFSVRTEVDPIEIYCAGEDPIC